jgi:hypothetical protein
VTGYTGYSGSAELQEGNFLALHFEAPEADSITVEVVGGHSGPRELDSDGLVVARIENTEQSIRAVAYFGESGMIIKEYALDDLTLLDS